MPHGLFDLLAKGSICEACHPCYYLVVAVCYVPKHLRYCKRFGLELGSRSNACASCNPPLLRISSSLLSTFCRLPVQAGDSANVNYGDHSFSTIFFSRLVVQDVQNAKATKSAFLSNSIGVSARIREGRNLTQFVATGKF